MPRKKTKQEREAETLRVAAVVVDHFDKTYGQNAARLDMWQQLCRDVGVEVGRSITQCQKNLRGIYINIVDYVHAKQFDRSFRKFDSPKELSNYIRNNRAKMFPRAEAKKNPILRWMLIHLC